MTDNSHGSVGDFDRLGANADILRWSMSRMHTLAVLTAMEAEGHATRRGTDSLGQVRWVLTPEQLALFQEHYLRMYGGGEGDDDA